MQTTANRFVVGGINRTTRGSALFKLREEVLCVWIRYYKTWSSLKSLSRKGVVMSRVPMGKVLLRNVIRHTDAHNKIQEESEMWKLRDMEKQAQERSCHRRPAPAYLARGSMHCDRIAAEGRSSSEDRLGERSEREARYWTRKLYEFEASDPDRWGHSGFKELYPEEFQSDSDKESSDGENVQRRKKTKASLESEKHKRSKKSARKKKKKKKEKKRKKAGDSADDRSCSDSGAKRRKRSSGKTKHRRRRREKEQETRADSSAGDSHSEGEGEEQAAVARKRGVSPEAQGEPPRKRRSWKETNEEQSEESSED
ncbi:NKAP domain containing 1 [Brienomyrus brachyistius]|uniref:NKAP domain containing 1 n=1 Tax=Brienomyrus brachyistius TaxID=42636 RepID=UPI0020B44C71|nr:NKAP domain containing 1 [Brienomyrus brachyistius]